MSRNGFAMVVVRFVLDEGSREGLRFSVSLRAFGLRTGGGGLGLRVQRTLLYFVEA